MQWFSALGGANPPCIGVKGDLELKDVITGAIDHIQGMNVRILHYELESWGQRALLDNQRDKLQSVWENFGLVNTKEWHSYRELILKNLNEIYLSDSDEYSTTVRREFKTPIDSIEFEEQIIGDFVSRTGDLPKVMYIDYILNGHVFNLVTDFEVSLAGFCLNKLDRAAFYVAKPIFTRASIHFRLSKAYQSQIKGLALSLQSIFHLDIHYYPGFDVVTQYNVKDRWYKLDEECKHN